MSRVKSPLAVCPACGTTNPADARFCVRCAARLGAEPSIVAPRLSAPSRPIGSGAIPSRPAALPARRADTTAFWVKLGIGGLLLLIGFVCWSVYILTDVKTVAQMPTGQGGGAVVEAPAVPAVAPSASVPPAVPPAVSPPATVPAASTVAPSASSDAPIAVVPAPVAPRSRRANRSAGRAAEENAAASGGWVEPLRPPAVTSSPSYQDAGPPIVRGPEPRETAPVPVTVPVPSSPDLGPPVVEGPGPRYDYSRSGGAGR